MLFLHPVNIEYVFPFPYPGPTQKKVIFLLFILCPFAVYYLRYAVRPFFTISRIYLTDGKRAGQKVHRKVAIAVQNVKTLLLFVPFF